MLLRAVGVTPLAPKMDDLVKYHVTITFLAAQVLCFVVGMACVSSSSAWSSVSSSEEGGKGGGKSAQRGAWMIYSSQLAYFLQYPVIFFLHARKIPARWVLEVTNLFIWPVGVWGCLLVLAAGENGF